MRIFNRNITLGRSLPREIKELDAIKQHYQTVNPLIKPLINNRMGRFKENAIYDYVNGMQSLKPAEEEIKNANKINRSFHITTATYDNDAYNSVPKGEGNPAGYNTVNGYTLFADIDILDDNKNIDDIQIKTALQEAINHIVEGLSEHFDKRAIYSLYSGGGAYVIVDPVVFRDFFETNQTTFDKHVLIETCNMLLSSIWDKVSSDVTDFVKLDIVNSNMRWMKVPFGVHKSLDVVVTPLKNHKLQDYDVYQLRNWNRHFKLDHFKWFMTAPYVDQKVIGLGEYIAASKSKVKGMLEFNDNTIDLPGKLNQSDSNRVLEIMNNEGLFPEFIEFLFDNDIGSQARIYGILGSYFGSIGIDPAVINSLIKQNKGKTDSYIVNNYSKLMCPSYHTIYDSKDGFPRLGLGEFTDILPSRPPFKSPLDETIQLLDNYIAGGVSYKNELGESITWNHKEKRLIFLIEGIETSFNYDSIPFVDLTKKVKSHIEIVGDVGEIGQILRRKHKDQKLILGFRNLLEELIQSKEEFLNNYLVKKILKENPDGLKYLLDMLTPRIAGNTLQLRLSLVAKGIATILKQVIYIMYIGDSNIGKDMVNDVSNMVIPPELIKTATTLTTPALFRLAKEDTAAFVGKIVDMGDMGAKSEQERIESFIRAANRSTDNGRTQSHIISEQNSLGNYVAQEYQIDQFPSINTSSVHYYQDAQITSRTIPIAPEENREGYYEYQTKFNEQTLRLDDSELESGIRYWKHLINVYEDIDGFINPYTDIFNKSLKGSHTEKRLNRIMGDMVNMYALFRYTKRQVIERDGKHYILIDRQDMKDMFRDVAPVQETMMYGISHNFKKFVNSPDNIKLTIQTELEGLCDGKPDLIWDIEENEPGTYFTKTQVVRYVFDSSTKMYDEVQSWLENGLIEFYAPLPTRGAGKPVNIYRLSDLGEIQVTEEDYQKCEEGFNECK